MQDGAALTLIVPGMGRELAQAGPLPAMPQLAQLAARGCLRHAWDRGDLTQATHYPWQRGLLAALQLEPSAHPSAALSAVAHGLDSSAIAHELDSSAVAHELDSRAIARELDSSATADDLQQHGPSTRSGAWWHLERVHLAAGLNHLSLVELGASLQPTAEQCAALEPQLRQHLQAAGARFESLPGGCWLLQLPTTSQPRTVCPEAAAANDLEQAMPQGEGGAALRRLMTELQMLLHEHPVNQQRSRQGLPAVNALWAWGNGCLAAQASRPLPEAFGAHDFLRGIYRHYGRTVRAAPSSGAELLAALEEGQHAVAVLEPLIDQLDAAAQFEHQWLMPLARGLRTRCLVRLELVLDGWHLSIDRRGLRRFWRRPLPPGSWVA